MSPFNPEAPGRLSRTQRASSEEPPLRSGPQKSQLTFLKSLVPWTFTILLLIVTIIIVKVYEAKGVITPSQKNEYQFLTTAIILFLALSFLESFKDLAKSLRSHLKHRFNPSARTERLIDGFDSLLSNLQLAYSPSQWSLRLIAVASIVLMLTAQMVAAIISLTWDIQDGKDYTSIYIRENEIVRTSNLTCYFKGRNDTGCPSQVTTDTRARAYGEMAQAQENGDFTDIESVIDSKYNHFFYRRYNTTVQEFAYRFNEYNVRDTRGIYPYFTNRVITASSEECRQYPEVDSSDATFKDNLSAKNFTYENDGTNGTILIPNSALGREGTTYIYRGFHRPSKADQIACGDRCVTMWAYRNPSGNSQTGTFFECNVSVSDVTNSERPEHDIPDGVVREAIAAIALQGQYSGPVGDVEDQNWTQCQFYADQASWDVPENDVNLVGAYIAEFAMGSLAEMVDRNPHINITGSNPYLGSMISVRWGYLEALLASIFAAHSLVVLLNFWALKTTPDKHDSIPLTQQGD